MIERYRPRFVTKAPDLVPRLRGEKFKDIKFQAAFSCTNGAFCCLRQVEAHGCPRSLDRWWRLWSRRHRQSASPATSALVRISLSGEWRTSTETVKNRMISDSIASYPGNCPCPCPYSYDRVGRNCGVSKRSMVEARRV
jgi:hypothetical protein